MKLLLLLFLFVWISVVIVVGHPQIESLEDSPIQLAPFDVSQSQDSLDRTLFSDDSGNGLDRSSSPSFGRAALDLTSLNDEQDFDEALQPLDLTMEQDSLFPPTELFADSDIRCSPDDENVSLFGKRRRDSNACSAPPSGVENLGPSKNRPPEPNDMKSLGFESNEELQNLFSFKDDYEMCPIEVFQLSTIPVCEYFGQTTIIRTLGIEDVILFDIGLGKFISRHRSWILFTANHLTNWNSQ